MVTNQIYRLRGLDVLKRFATALIIIPPFLLLIRHGPPYALSIMVTVASILGLYEFYHMTLSEKEAGGKFGAIILGAVLCTLFQWASYREVIFFLALIVMAIFLGYALSSEELSVLSNRISVTVLGIIYVPFMLSHVTLLNKLPQGVLWVFLLLLTAWVGDTFAYVIGSWLGRHKLSPRISPRKSVEGFCACFVGAILTVFACRAVFLPALTIADVLAVGSGIALFGQLGDLSESMIKRGARLKDSGALFPGHGGMLDRVDSFLFAAPFLYYFLVYKMFSGAS